MIDTFNVLNDFKFVVFDRHDSVCGKYLRESDATACAKEMAEECPDDNPHYVARVVGEANLAKAPVTYVKHVEVKK